MTMPVVYNKVFSLKKNYFYELGLEKWFIIKVIELYNYHKI